MSDIMSSIYDIGILDDLSRNNTSIHKIHPLSKFITTIIYLVCIVSFNKYQISGLIPFVFYPIILFTVAEIPIIPLVKRVLIVSPFILGIGVINIFFDKISINIGELIISSGWITFFSITIKSILTILASLLLIATTGMENIGVALRIIKIPKIFVLQILLTYRYISILLEEVARMMRAYSLRAPGEKGIKLKDLGEFTGQLLLRSYDRAQRVYEAMNLRGFQGEYNTGVILKIKLRDYIYLVLWSAFFVIARNFNISVLIGNILSGGIK